MPGRAIPMPTARALLLIAVAAPLAVLLAVLAPAFAASAPILGTLVLGLIGIDAWLAGRLAALDFAAGEDVEFMHAKIVTARFYGDHILNRAGAMRDSICEGADAVTAMALEAF